MRDDIRQISHIIVPEERKLSVTSLVEGELVEKTTIFNGDTLRAHLCLRKFDGKLFIAHVSNEQDGKKLYVNERIIETKDKNLDFPFLAFSQDPIGHVPKEQSKFALLSYKSLETGSLYLRRIEEGSDFSDEFLVKAPKCVGGVDFGISDNEVIFRINAIIDNRIVPMFATSHDGGISISDFEEIDLSELGITESIPASSPVFVDYAKNTHIPLYGVNGDGFNLVDYVPGKFAAVAITVPKDDYNFGTLEAFPKKPDIHASFSGNGLTDGVGIIATVSSSGKLFSANSQAGGTFYPEPSIINYDMPKVFSLKTSQCYSTVRRPNNVSMDYLFIEADDSGTAISRNLFIETWDMPLPEPLVEAHVEGSKVKLNIVRDAHFIVGKTTFEFSNPMIEIIDLEFHDGRNVTIHCNLDNLSGVSISFVTKDLFYFHKATATIK